MSSKTLTLKINTATTLPVAFDVGKSRLDFYFEIAETGSAEVKAVSGFVANRTEAILTLLNDLKSTALEHGFQAIGVICEPTGPYSEKLLRLARQNGHFTALVSGESVHKLKVLENNDSGKSDIKDPRVILMLAKMDKILCHRNLNGHYRALREYNRDYDSECNQITAIKGTLHGILVRLFPDLNMSSGFLYKETGNAIAALYYWNPYRMIEEGWEQFENNIRCLAPGVHKETLDKIWKDAETSCYQAQEPIHLEAMEFKVKGLWDRMRAHTKRIAELKERMIELYREFLEMGERVPKADPGFLTELRIARILGETGALTDYHSLEGLMKYAGLNLRERRSGQFVGQVRLSKKGRVPLRRVLGEAVFRLVKKTELYGPYYHAKKENGMPGTKILAAVERKLLGVFYTLGVKAVAFDPQRFAMCESHFRKAA
jgi:transposase